ncbi:MAG: hypothetical protein EBZ48_16445 [Proteobacteria bacterium]|nr:hypothetical protein [Pseudomonadota bacterium]
MKHHTPERDKRQELALYFSDSELWFGEAIYEALKLQGGGGVPLLDWRDRYLAPQEQISRDESPTVNRIGRLIERE